MPSPDTLEALKKLVENIANKNTTGVSTEYAVSEQQAIDLLIELVKDESRALCLREQAIKALGLLGDTRVSQQLIELLKDRNPYIRREAAVALGQLGDKQAVEALIEALKDDELHVRRAAAEALEKLGDTQTIEPLLAAIKLESALVNALPNWASALRLMGKKKETDTYNKPLDEISAQTTIVLTEGEIDKSAFVKQVLTPQYLLEKLAPYLQALADLQHILNKIQGRVHRDVRIIAITQKSPISVSLDGASEAIQLVREIVVPWRRKHAEKLAHLLEQEKMLEIESKKAEILEKRARAEKERIELSAQRESVERLRLENEKLRLELQRAKIELALQLLSTVTLSEEDKISYVIKLLQPLNVITSSAIEIIPNEQRPTSAST